MSALLWILGAWFIVRGRWLIPDTTAEATNVRAPYRALLGCGYMLFGVAVLTIAAIRSGD